MNNDTIQVSRAEYEALRRDAERLRFVEDTIGWNVCRYSYVLQCWVAAGMYEVDAAINMAANGEGVNRD